MANILRFFKHLLSINSCLAEEMKRQTVGGYMIESNTHGPERYFTYCENGRELVILVEFTILNDVKVFTNSLKKWHTPRGEELSDFDYQKVLNRATSYFSCWGEVILDDSPLPNRDDVKESLREAGIPFEELEGGIIQYTSTVEEERERKGGFFNR